MATILFIIILKARRLQLVEKEQTWQTTGVEQFPSVLTNCGLQLKLQCHKIF